MAKKKREHVVFDQMLKEKKSIPFAQTNRETAKERKTSMKKLMHHYTQGK